MTPVDSSILPITSNGDTPSDTHSQIAPAARAANTLPNAEWQLADFVDAIAAEVDRAEDTLSLKSYARGISFAIKQLSLDLEVSVRRDPDGRILFRTRNDEQAGGTVLKLDFAQMLQSQLEGVRKQLHQPVDPRELSTLPGITDEHIRQLNAIAVYSVDDLERYTQTAAMIAEVSRKTGISDPQIRKWRKLPFLHAIKPESGPPGATVLVEGGNFGLEPDPTAVVLFAGQPASIVTWSESRLTVAMPHIRGAGFVFGVIDGQVTNSVSWEAQSIDLVVGNIVVAPAEPLEGEPIFVTAELLNRGGTATGSFEVEWTIDDQPQGRQRHGTLLANQQSQELSVRRRVSLPSGTHTIRFTADPDATLPDSNRANSTFSRELTVKPRHQLVIGDFRRIETLDPILTQSLGPADALNLIFRGLTRLDPETGRPVPDIAKSISVARPQGPGIVHLELRDDVTFHDGTPVTAADVAFTYANAKQGNSPWHKLVQPITVNVDESKRTVTFLMQHVSQALLSPLLRIGIVPRHVYEADPRGFGAKPIGSGPFKVEQVVSEERMTLRPWEKFVGGSPRLDQLDIALTTDVERLFKLVMSRQVLAATLPYIEGFETELARRGEWIVVAIKDKQQSLLHVQSKRIHERLPNQHDTTWNAHLWYVDPELNDR